MGSYYVPPKQEFIDNNEVAHYSANGLICITSNPAGTIDAEIAHEWTHHLQFHSGFNFTEVDLSVDIELLQTDHKEFFREYYSRQHEREALFSECTRTADKHSRWLWYLTTGQTWKNTIK